MDKLKEIEELLEEDDYFSWDDKIWLIATVKEERKCFSLLEKAVEMSFGDKKLRIVMDVYHELRTELGT